MDTPVTMVPVRSIDGHNVIIPSDRAALRIDLAWLETHGACQEGKHWFSLQFPEGCTYYELRSALENKEWETWLLLKVGGDTATAGDRGTATAGYSGTATAGHSGVISILYWDYISLREKVVIGYIGEGGLKPNVAYRLNAQAQFEEVTP